MSDNPKTRSILQSHPHLIGDRAAQRRAIGNMSGPAGAVTVPFDTGRVHGPFLPPCADCGAVVAYGGHNVDCPQDAPTFTPTDRQRRRIAGARAYIAQRLTVPYSGQLDTGTVHGPMTRLAVALRLDRADAIPAAR